MTVDHVETSVASATAELGSTLALRVRVGLGSLRPEDVEVQAVAGRVDEEDRITDAAAVPLKPVGSPGAGVSGSTRARCPSTGRGRSATRCGCCRVTGCWHPGRSWGWWRCHRRTSRRRRAY
ncbi:hypothetical protein ACFQV4_32495 [Streptomyces thermocarboxydus]